MNDENKLNNQDWVLYRHYDCDENLLYVGLSGNFLSRTHQHQRNSGWFHLISTIKITHYATKQEMVDAELLAIKTENPIWNKAENPNYESAHDHFQKLKLVIFAKNRSDFNTSFIASHKELFNEIDELQKIVPPLRKSSSWASLYIINALQEVDYSIWHCDNCIAIGDKDIYETWAGNAYTQLQKSRGQ